MDTYRPAPCQECKCESGETVCGPEEKCFMKTYGEDPWGNSQCSWTEEDKDQCCPICKGCQNKRTGIRKLNNDTWNEDNGCLKCSCHEGRVSCDAYSCGSLYGCLDVRTTPGTCCSFCADKDYKSRISIKPHCMSPEYTKCKLDCEFGRKIASNGCFICECRLPKNTISPEATIIPTLLIRCRLEDGGYVKDGEKWIDNCNRSCKCVSGHTLCTLLNCPIETLKCRHPIVKLGNCCPTCITESISIETIMPKTSSDSSQHKDAHCNNDIASNGAIFDVDICTRCMCTEDGSLMCEERSCPPLLCHRPIAVEGQCCPICQEDITSDVSLPIATGTCISSSGAHHATGSVWRVDLCTVCYCDALTATAHCFHRTCNPIVCVMPRFVKGQCCPKCLTDDEVNNLLLDNKNTDEDNMYYYRILLMVMAVALMVSIVVVAVLLSLMRRRRLRKLRRMSRTPLHTDSCDLSSTLSFLGSDTGTKPIYLNNRTLNSQISEISASIDNVAVESIASTASSSEQSICKSDAHLCDSRIINNEAAKRYVDTTGKEQLRTACAALRRGVVERTHSLVVRIPSITSKDRKINREKRRSM